MLRNRRNLLVVPFVFGFVAAFSFLSAKEMESAEAVSASGFKAGNIINDFTMSNYKKMSESQIQTFLKSKNSCNDTNIGKAKQYPSLKYSIKDGHFVCMADELFNGETAAHIIWQAAQDYKINPQVLIVLLQKEQGLVTDTWPNQTQYRSATGFGCPDTAACDSKYYGFKNQVRQAANMFRTVLDGGWSNYKVGKNTIQYNPKSSCGSSSVTIENLATASLYRYTPYQPNKAALNAGFGTGDSCSAYGNRNFYLYFTDWFGSTQTTFNLTSVYIPDGTYNIKSHGGKNISFTGKTNGAVAQLADAKNSDKLQQFTFTRQSDGYYVVKNVSSGRVLDVYNAQTTNDTVTQLYDEDGTCAQRWAIEFRSGKYYFRSACSSKALTVKGGKTSTVGTNIVINDDSGSTSQQWQLVKVDESVLSDGMFKIKTKDNLAFNPSENSISTDSAINIEKNKSNNLQRFYLEKDSAGYYRIKNVASYLYLTIKSGSKSNNAQLIQSKSTNECSQKFYLEKNGSAYWIKNMCSGKALNIPDSKTSQAGLGVQQYTQNNSDGQKIKIEKTDFSGKTIGEGEYVINSAKPTLVMAPSSSKNVLKKDNNSKNQRFAIEYDSSSKAYKIKNISTGLYLASKNTESSKGEALIFKKDSNNCDIKWYIPNEGNGYYNIVNSCSGLLADIAGAVYSENTTIQLWEENKNDAQKWKFASTSNRTIENGTYTIMSKINNNYVLDVAGNEKKNGTNVQLYKTNGTDAQKWNIEYDATQSSYKITSKSTKKSLDVAGGKMKNSTNMQMYTSNDSCAQRWNVVNLGSGYYSITSKCLSKYAIDAKNGKAANGTNIQLYLLDGTKAQSWKLKRN